MNYGTVGKHPADTYPVQHLDIHHGRPERAHFSLNRPENGDTNRLLNHLWIPSTSDSNLQGLEFCCEKNGNSNWITTYLCAFHQTDFWRGFKELSNYSRAATMLLTSFMNSFGSAFNEGNGKIGNWPVTSPMEALVKPSLSADRSRFLSIQLYHQDTHERFQTQKRWTSAKQDMGTPLRSWHQK